MTFNLRGRKVVSFLTGDTVILEKTSNASLNLYYKTRNQGMVYILCPCDVKTGDHLQIVQPFGNGYILRSTINNRLYIAHPNDLKKVI